MDPDTILDYLKNKEVMDQARGIGANRMGLPKPQQTDNQLKDFLANAMGAVGNLPFAKTGGASKPYTPMASPPPPPTGPAAITGGQFPSVVDNVRSTIHDPNSAAGLSLHPAVKDTLGGPGVNVKGVAENANKYNPRVNEILGELSKRDLPIDRVADTSGDTTYITAINPTRPEGQNHMRIRVPKPGDDHPSRMDYTHKFMTRNGPGSYYDLSTKGKASGRNQQSTIRNVSGHKYGDNLDNLYAAIDKMTGKKLIPANQSPVLSNTPKNPVAEPPQPHIHDMIDKVLKETEAPPAYDRPRVDTHEGFDFAPGQKQPNSVGPGRFPGIQANENFKGSSPQTLEELMAKINKTLSDPGSRPVSPTNIKRDPGSIDTSYKGWYDNHETHPDTRAYGYSSKNTENMYSKKAANTGEFPKDPLITRLESTDAGKYSLASTKQQLQARGINPEGMSYIQMVMKLQGLE